MTTATTLSIALSGVFAAVAAAVAAALSRRRVWWDGHWIGTANAYGVVMRRLLTCAGWGLIAGAAAAFLLMGMAAWGPKGIAESAEQASGFFQWLAGAGLTAGGVLAAFSVAMGCEPGPSIHPSAVRTDERGRDAHSSRYAARDPALLPSLLAVPAAAALVLVVEPGHGSRGALGLPPVLVWPWVSSMVVVPMMLAAQTATQAAFDGRRLVGRAALGLRPFDYDVTQVQVSLRYSALHEGCSFWCHRAATLRYASQLEPKALRRWLSISLHACRQRPTSTRAIASNDEGRGRGSP